MELLGGGQCALTGPTLDTQGSFCHGLASWDGDGEVPEPEVVYQSFLLLGRLPNQG